MKVINLFAGKQRKTQNIMLEIYMGDIGKLESLEYLKTKTMVNPAGQEGPGFHFISVKIRKNSTIIYSK